MKKYCLITTTCKSKIEAKKIAKILLKNKLIACSQISIIESLYFWKEKLVCEGEFLLTLKTKIDLYKEIEKIILQNHSYQTPQITMFRIANGLQSYFDWVEMALRKN